MTTKTKGTTFTLVIALCLDALATFLVLILILFLPLSLLLFGVATLMVGSRCPASWRTVRAAHENGWSAFASVSLWSSGLLLGFTSIYVYLKRLDIIDQSLALSNLMAIIGLFFMAHFARFFGTAIVALPGCLLTLVKAPRARDRKRCLIALALFTAAFAVLFLGSADTFQELLAEPAILGTCIVLGAPYGLAVGSHFATPGAKPEPA